MSEAVKSNYDYGCLMALPPESYCDILVKFAKKIIPADILYTEINDDSYGYTDIDVHTTVKYGYEPDLTRKNLATILTGTKPFNIILKGISLFQNDAFDVVKWDVESPVLNQLRQKADVYKNQDKFPDYHPHMTLGYVKPGTFSKTLSNLDIIIPITKFKYSGQDGNTLYINL